MALGVCNQCHEGFQQGSPNHENHKKEFPDHSIRWDVEVNESVKAATGRGEQAIEQLPSIAFQPLVEEWSYLRTEAGLVVKLKTVVTKLYDSGKKAPDGMPQYIVAAQNVVTVLTEEQFEREKKLRPWNLK